MIDFNIVQEELKDYDEDIWKIKKERCKRYITKFQAKSNIKIESKSNCYILHCLLGDQHLGNDGTDMEKMEYDAKLIGNCEYAIAYNLGDSMDNFIKSKIIEALINANTTPKQQLKLFNQYIEFFKGKLKVLISGNHERWSKEVTGIDWLNNYCKTENIIYSPDEFKITFIHNEIEYKFLFRHKYKYNSVYNPSHSSKQMMRFLDNNCDVYAKAHDHISSLEQSTWSGSDRVFISVGSYKIADVFSRKVGYPDSKSVMPCFITSPDKKYIIPFYFLEDGINYVNYLNEQDLFKEI